MHRLIAELRPRWVLAENVPALRTRGADEVLSSLEGLGYTCWPLVVGADDVGAPHRRKRVWIVANASGRRCGGAGERQSEQPGRAEIERPSSIANAAGELLRDEPGRLGGEERQAIVGAGWWTVERRLGRGTYGIPKEMDGGGIDGEVDDAKTVATSDRDNGEHEVCGVRFFGESTETSPDIQKPECRDCLPTMPPRSRPEGWNEESKEDEELQGLRECFHSMPQQKAFDVQQHMPLGTREKERLEAVARWLDGSWERGIPRVAKGQKDRVNRLRGLGNSVVPTIVEIIGRSIIHAEAANRTKPTHEDSPSVERRQEGQRTSVDHGADVGKEVVSE